MTAEPSKLLKQLIDLGEIDTSLARIGAQRKKLEDELAESQGTIESRKKVFDERSISIASGRERFRKEEARLKLENDKLVERRKALDSFPDYKTQQAAQKEIEQVSKQIAAQEEKLLGTLEALEQEEQEVSQLKEDLQKLQEDYEKLAADSGAELSTLEERFGEKESAREELASAIGERDLIMYDRIRERYPMDPVVAVQNGSCSGCFIQVGAQMVVQISRGQGLVKCRGCGRILYLSEQVGAESSETAVG